jgi:hypothetical protein
VNPANVLAGLTIKIFPLSLKRKRDRILVNIEDGQQQKIKNQILRGKKEL